MPHNYCMLLAVATCRVACHSSHGAYCIATQQCHASCCIAWIHWWSTDDSKSVNTCAARHRRALCRRARPVAPIHAAGGNAAAAAHAEHARGAAEPSRSRSNAAHSVCAKLVRVHPGGRARVWWWRRSGEKTYSHDWWGWRKARQRLKKRRNCVGLAATRDSCVTRCVGAYCIPAQADTGSQMARMRERHGPHGHV